MHEADIRSIREAVAEHFGNSQNFDSEEVYGMPEADFLASVGLQELGFDILYEKGKPVQRRARRVKVKKPVTVPKAVESAESTQAANLRLPEAVNPDIQPPVEMQDIKAPLDSLVPEVTRTILVGSSFRPGDGLFFITTPLRDFLNGEVVWKIQEEFPGFPRLATHLLAPTVGLGYALLSRTGNAWDIAVDKLMGHKPLVIKY